MIAWSSDDGPSSDLGRVLERVLPSHPHARDIASAVEMAMAGEPGRSVPATDRVLWRAARALAAVGDRSAASAVLGVTSAWADWSATLDLSGLPMPTLHLLESGLVQAASSSVLGGGILAALDLRRLPADAAGLELVYLPLAHRLVEACAPLWELSRGRGALVVRGCFRHVGVVPGARRPDPARGWLGRMFRDGLRDQAARREWSQAPLLVVAD
jgi:hypothetical protein